MRDIEIRKLLLSIDPDKEQAVTKMIVRGQLGNYLSRLINSADMSEKVDGKLSSLEEQMDKMMFMLEKMQTNGITAQQLINTFDSNPSSNYSQTLDTNISEVSTATLSEVDSVVQHSETNNISKQTKPKPKKKRGLGSMKKMSAKMAELEKASKN